MSFGLMVAGFLAVANPARAALAQVEQAPSRRTVALALGLGAGLVAAGVVAADPLLDALDISPESFRIAAGIVLAVCGARTLAWPQPAGPFGALLVTPDLACLAIALAADDHEAKAIVAAALALAAVAITLVVRPRRVPDAAAQFLAALEVVVAVALFVSGVRDV